LQTTEFRPVLYKNVVGRKCGRRVRLVCACEAGNGRGKKPCEGAGGRWRARSGGQAPRAAQPRPPIAMKERPRSDSGGLPVIVLQQPAQPLAANDRAFGDLRGRFFLADAAQPGIADALMRALLIIIGDVFAEDVPQVRFAKDDEVFQTFLPNRLHPAFRVGVQIRRPRPDLLGVEALGLQDCVELGGELGIVIANQQRRPLR